MPYRVTESIGGGEYERRDGHKPHYFLVIAAIGNADHEGGLPSDDLSETSAGVIGLTIVDGIPQKTAAHWSFYSEFPQHYLDYENIWIFDTYESAKIFCENRESKVIETLGIDFDNPALRATKPSSPFDRK